jgi:hypothetical protein
MAEKVFLYYPEDESSRFLRHTKLLGVTPQAIATSITSVVWISNLVRYCEEGCWGNYPLVRMSCWHLETRVDGTAVALWAVGMVTHCDQCPVISITHTHPTTLISASGHYQVHWALCSEWSGLKHGQYRLLVYTHSQRFGWWLLLN